MSFTLKNFVGGLNNRDYVQEENQAMKLMNMAFNDSGVMEKRKGTQLFDEFTADGPITWIDEFKPQNEAHVLIRASKTKMYVGDVLLRETPKQVHGLNHSGKYFFCDSTGLYAYGKFDEEASTYVKHVGTPIADYTLMQVVSPPDGFTALGNEHTEGVRVIDYTNRKVWYEPCTQEMKDTFKGANVVPKGTRFITNREGRLYIAGDDEDDDTVAITDTGNPYYFPAVLPLQLPPNSDRISGLSVFNDVVVVGRRLDMHAIIGDTNRTDAGLPVFELKKLNAHCGFASQRSVVNAHNYLFYLGADMQFYALRDVSTSSDALSTTVISKDLDLRGVPLNLKEEDMWHTTGVFFNNCYIVTFGDKILYYNYLYQAWTVYEHINATSLYVLFTTLMMGNQQGNIVIHSNDYLDLGKPYKAYWTSKWFDMSDANAFKMYKDFFITSRSVKGETSQVKVLFEVDYENEEAFYDVTSKHSVYGESVWGDVYVNRDINVSLPFFVHRRGRQIRITFSNSDYIFATVPTVADLKHIHGIYDGILVYVEEKSSYYTHRDLKWSETNLTYYNQGMCVLQISGEYEFKWKR